MPHPPTALFFGSFLDYSAQVLTGLVAAPASVKIIGVVTTPPQPAGRQKILTPTPVEARAQELNLPVFTPTELTDETLHDLTTQLGETPELLITAGYGKLLPPSWLSFPSTAALNLHFSLLPKYRGANPAEWAILMGETETGITLIEMSPEFDTGLMISQARLPLLATDTRESVYQKLYALGAQVLPIMLDHYLQPENYSADHSTTDPDLTFFQPPQPQPPSPTPYAKRFQRDDAWVAWPAFRHALQGTSTDANLASPLLQSILTASHQSLDATFLARAVRALAGFPNVWTLVPTVKGEKRMKILAAAVQSDPAPAKLELIEVQIEGQSSAAWNQVKNSLTE